MCAVTNDEVRKSPLVSVGIPTYNRPAGLRRTLECITGQTYRNLEIIISDNCSFGPETEAVVRDFIAKDRRIQYYRREENKGSLNNFKFVLENATGEYFMWAADDDEWAPFFIEKIMRMFSSLNESYIAIGLEAQYVDENLKKMNFFAEGRAFYGFESRSVTTRLLHMLKFKYGNLVYSIFRMSLLKKIKKMVFFENEIPFMLQVMQYGNWKVIPEVGLYKKTNKATYIQAKWEMCGGWLPKDLSFWHLSFWLFPIRIWYSLRYHCVALLNIRYSISTLDIKIYDKIILYIFAFWVIITHFLSLSIGFKKSNYLSK